MLPNLCVLVSFVIANVSQALIGMDILGSNQLSLIQSFYGFYLVNSAGALTQLHPRGHLLYLEAWPREFGFNNCRGSNLQSMQASLLNDKGRTQEEAVATSGGASHDSLPLENLREQQAKNTANLGTTTALPEEGAKRRRKKKKKKPAAKEASQDRSQRSLEQQGQKPATTQLRSLEKPRIIKELEMVAEKEESNNSLGSIDLQQLSLRILLTLSLSKKWLITTTRAREACSQDALGEQLRNIGLGQHKMQPNIFCGDELVILLDQTCILIGGSEMQQECFFCELSALTSLESPKKLAQDNQISFGNLILDYQEASNSISLSVSPCFVDELLQNHDLAQDEFTQSLQQERLQNQEASEHIALEADQKELYKQAVGDLDWLAKSCRPDLSFEAHLLAQSLESPTTSHQKQLRKVLRHLAQTKHCSLSLHPTTKMTREKLQNLELVAFSSTSWTEAGKATSTAYLQLWGAFLIASCETSGAQQQDIAELESMRLALGLACLVRSLLQQLDMDKLEEVVPIKLRTSSWKEELVDGRPIAQQLGLSRRNKHQQLRGQLQISKVHPSKNLAHSLSHNASDKTMLAKLRINPKGDETGALSTVFGQRSAFLLSSSSLVVGMVSLEHPKMEKPQLRQLALISSESCNESLSKNLANTSLASLTLCSLSLERLTLESWSFPTPSLTLRSLIRTKDRLHSLTMQSLSLEECSLQSLTGQSLSLIDGNCFQNLSFREVSLEDGNQELEENLATNLLNRRAETNSFSRIGLQEKKPHKEAKTNSFWTQSFRGILSLCWPIFLLCSFQLVCSALFSKTSFPIQSLHQNQLEAAYSNNFQISSLQPEELAAAYFSKSFQQESLQQDELTASCFQSPTRARQLSSLQQEELSRSILDDFDQLDLAMSLSFLAFNKNQLQEDSFGRPSFGQMELYSIHQLDLDTSLSYQHFSFHSHSTSFEQRALQCTALLFRIRVCNQKLQTRSVQSFQLTGQQLTGRQFGFSLVSGGAFSTALQTRASPEPWHCPASTLPSLSFEDVNPSCKIALRRRTLPACTLISLSLAIIAWLNNASLRACRGTSLRRSLFATTFPPATSMTALQSASFRRAASAQTSLAIPSRSTRSLTTTSFKRSSSQRASTRTTFRRTSSKRRTWLAMLLFSFLFNIFFSNSLGRKELEKKDELSTTSLELELEKLVANQTCSLDLYHGHLEQNLWQIQLQQLSLEKNKQKIQQQLSAAVPDRELSQLHLHQLCLPDPASRRQVPEESLSTSFTKKELSEQDLSNISLDKFFPENFAEQLPDKQLQQNLSTDQKQLQKNNLTKNNLQQLSFKKPSFPEKTLNNELATTFAKKSLEERFAFQTFLFDSLAFQSPASEQLGEHNLNQQQLEQSSFNQTEEEACKEQLLSTGFPETSLDQQLFSTSLVQQSGAKAASRPELLNRELPEEELADQNFVKKSFAATTLRTRPSARQLKENQLEEENFTETSFEALCLDSFPGTACKEELLPDQLLQQQPSSTNFQQHSFSASSFQQQSFRPGFSASSLENRTFRQAASQTAASQKKPSATAAWQQQPSGQKL